MVTPEPEESYCSYQCFFYETPTGTFEILKTNGTKFDTVFNNLYKGTGNKLSIKSARYIYFDLNDIVDEVSIYLHTSIVVKKYD